MINDFIRWVSEANEDQINRIETGQEAIRHLLQYYFKIAGENREHENQEGQTCSRMRMHQRRGLNLEQQFFAKAFRPDAVEYCKNIIKVLKGESWGPVNRGNVEPVLRLIDQSLKFEIPGKFQNISDHLGRISGYIAMTLTIISRSRDCSLVAARP